MTDYGYVVEVREGYDEAVLRTRLAMRAEGFSILTEMHVGGLLGPEAGNDRQYLIMGAWAAPAADVAIAPDVQAAGHLQCNVVVQEQGESALVATLDPEDSMVASDDAAAQTAEVARRALSRVLERVSAG